MADATSVDLLREYERGQVLRAADVNALISVARRQVTGDDLVGDDDAVAVGGHGRKLGDRSNRGAWLKNVTAAVAPPGAVMVPVAALAIVDLAGWTAKRRTAGGLEPCLVSDLASGLPENCQGHARWASLGAWCLYDHADGAPVPGQHWGPEVGSWKLSRGGSMDFVALGNSFKVGGEWYGNFVQPLAAKVFCVTNGNLAHGETCEVETLRSRAGSPRFERTGFTLEAQDLFLNSDDDAEAGTIVGVKWYDGVAVVDAMYCNTNDWLD